MITKFLIFHVLSNVSSRFVEFGEYKGNYYGMSLDSVCMVVAESKVCLLDVKPHVSKRSFSNTFIHS